MPPTSEAMGLAFSPDGRLVASSGGDGVRLWESVSGQERRHYNGHPKGLVQTIDFSPDGARLASAGLDGTALVWRVFEPAPANVSSADLQALWDDLAGDGVRAHRAVGSLIAANGAPRPS